MVKKKKRRKSKRSKKGIYTSIKSGKTFRFRSSWEERYMMWLDADHDIQSWDYECLKIPYVSSVRTKKIRNYIPDFLIKSLRQGNLVVEIKPQKKLDQPKVIKKTYAAQEWCQKNSMSFIIITEHELKLLGLL